MVFASITFLYWYLPVVLLVYYLLPKSWKNAWLLLASLLFYGWGQPRLLGILVISILIGYVAGLGLDVCKKNSKKKWRTGLLWIAIILESGTLVYFKYVDFFLENINQVTGLHIPLLKVVLPIGISFYTFQLISYLVDVYWEKEKPQRNLIDFAMYICLFTQLVAGPIVRYTEIAAQLKGRVFRLEAVKTGIRRFIFGLSKKVLLADPLGELCETIQGFQEPTIVSLWVSAIAFTMQIYFDFSGYSDMAIGLGNLFGFQFPENFQYPYAATSVTDFWRRWHMSLTKWFRDYIYIPFGGNRCKPWKQIRNLIVVWLLTGFWHGAEWNYILWGLYFAIILILEKLVNRSEEKQRNRFLGHIYVMLIVIIGFVIFKETDVLQIRQQLGGMFGLGGLALANQEIRYYLQSDGALLLIGVFGCIPAGKWLVGKVEEKKYGKKILAVAEPLVWILFLLLSTAYLVDGSYHPFLYFRF